LAKKAVVGVQTLVGIGLTFPVAVRCWLDQTGQTWRQIARRHQVVDLKAFSSLVNGSSDWPHDRLRNILAKELGVERSWLDAQLGS